MIEIENIAVSFGGVHALDHLSVTLTGPIVGIIGPNGAGKTTLLNVFSGFVVPQSGSILAFGSDLLPLAPHMRARWGLRRSFQTEQVVDDLSVADNVRVMLDALQVPDKAGEIARALRFVGLADRGSDLAATLTTFERRMVELAKALVGSPKVILLDEPGAGLPPNETAALRKIILGIHEHCGAMTLLIDHDVELIAATCPTTLVLDFGELIAFGPTGEVLKDERVRAAYLGMEEDAA